MKKQTRLFNLLFLTIWFNLIIVLNAIAALPITKQSNITPSLAPMLEKTLSAVVSVYVEGNDISSQGKDIFESSKIVTNIIKTNNHIQSFEGLGSGVIINSTKGYILTNNHVINGAHKIYIKLRDDREYTAQLIGCDQTTDIALIKINGPKNLAQIKIANSDTINVGDFVVAVGSPFGLGQTATAGIISAIGRNGLNIEGIENFIQTDASINRGSSGGALINLNGELIGINTAILASNGGNIGIGFAIPSNMAISFAKQLIKYGKIKRGQLGVKCNEITSDMMNSFNLKNQFGVLVSEILPNSAAQKAGIKVGDVIVSINGKSINHCSELRIAIEITEPGKSINIIIMRNGKPLEIKVIIQNKKSKPIIKSTIPLLQGVLLVNGTTKSGDKGIKIKNIEKDTMAYKLGLRKNDVIININRRRTRTIHDIIKIIERRPPMLMFNIIREYESIYLLLR
ncbi:serine endoprotease DegQ [Candidatus Pantoea edessiphila]|uniref:Serine endoprotease DegQ n=1 Tax=Candidatus Pantoea edessiphila TaxID=2044610 RepID=A0A2P5T031_9GAMM|nr:Do family serine endopeptidase [Candidatus Pantoea edessiphila]PPI87912.1 serine endoprotease DegQ [Candidatus Pantoea edessiphila]